MFKSEAAKGRLGGVITRIKRDLATSPTLKIPPSAPITPVWSDLLRFLYGARRTVCCQDFRNSRSARKFLKISSVILNDHLVIKGEIELMEFRETSTEDSVPSVARPSAGTLITKFGSRIYIRDRHMKGTPLSCWIWTKISFHLLLFLSYGIAVMEFLVPDNEDVLILHSHGCPWPGDTKSQNISSQCIHQVFREYSVFSTKRVRYPTNQFSQQWCWSHSTTLYNPVINITVGQHSPWPIYKFTNGPVAYSTLSRYQNQGLNYGQFDHQEQILVKVEAIENFFIQENAFENVFYNIVAMLLSVQYVKSSLPRDLLSQEPGIMCIPSRSPSLYRCSNKMMDNIQTTMP